MSIIIPVYNAEKYIADTLHSVLIQSYSHFEVIVVDNGSTDSSLDIINGYRAGDPRIRLVQLEENSGGPAKPRNVGMDNALGEFICFLDADDLWFKDKLTQQIALTKQFNFVSTGARYIDEKGQAIEKRDKLAQVFASKKITLSALCWQNPVTTSSTMIAADVIKQERFDEDPLLVGVEDCFLWMTLLLNPVCSPKLMCEPLIDYRVLHNSTSRVGGRGKSHVLKEYMLTKFALKHKRYDLLYLHIIKKSLRLFYRRMKS